MVTKFPEVPTLPIGNTGVALVFFFPTTGYYKVLQVATEFCVYYVKYVSIGYSGLLCVHHFLKVPIITICCYMLL